MRKQVPLIIDPDLMPVQIWFEINTTYEIEEDLGIQKIKTQDASSRIIADNLFDVTKSTVNRQINKLIEKGILHKEDGYYILENEEGKSFVLLDRDFVQYLLENFNVETINIYGWLNRRYSYRKMKHIDCGFTRKDIMEYLGLSYGNDRARKRITEEIEHLKTVGLIDYIRKPVGNTYIMYLTKVTTNINYVQEAQEIEKTVQQNEDITEFSVEEEQMEFILVPNEKLQMLSLPQLDLKIEDNEEDKEKNQKRLLKYSQLYLDEKNYSVEELREQGIKVVYVFRHPGNSFENEN